MNGSCHWAYTRKCHMESSPTNRNERERAAAMRERDDLPLKLQTSNNLILPLAHTSEETPDGMPGILRKTFSRRSWPRATTGPYGLLLEQGQERRFWLERQLLLLRGLEREKCWWSASPVRSVILAGWGCIYTLQPRAMTQLTKLGDEAPASSLR